MKNLFDLKVKIENELHISTAKINDYSKNQDFRNAADCKERFLVLTDVLEDIETILDLS